MTSRPKVFVRDATGLVREVGLFEQAMTAMNGVSPLAAIAFTPFWIYVGIPGGDPSIGVVLACLFGIFGYIAAYAMGSATFPRSGSPYVLQSRVLTPFIGWPSEVLMWIVWVTSLGLYPGGYFFIFAFIPSIYSMGISSGNQGLIATANWLATDPAAIIVFGTIFLILTALLAISGTKKLVRHFQLPVTIIAFIGIFLMIALYATASKEQFIGLLPKYTGNTYESILEAGRTLPTMVPVSYTFAAVMGAGGFSAGAANTYWNAWNAGEVKRAGDVKMQLLSMIIPSIVITLICVLTWSLLNGVVGRDFVIALVNLSYPGSEVVKGPLSLGASAIPYTALILANNFWLQFIILLGLTCAVLAYVPATWLLLTRDMFAWSFDRLLPEKLSEVSDRFHTPVWSILVIFVIAEIFLFIFTFFAQYMGGFMAIGWDATFAQVTIFCIAIALLPLKKELWEQSPVKTWRIGRIPLVTIVGLIGACFNAYAVYVYTFTPAVGFGLNQTAIMAVIAIIPLVLYPIIRAYRKRQGIDIDNIFRAIPPE